LSMDSEIYGAVDDGLDPIPHPVTRGGLRMESISPRSPTTTGGGTMETSRSPMTNPSGGIHGDNAHLGLKKDSLDEIQNPNSGTFGIRDDAEILSEDNSIDGDGITPRVESPSHVVTKQFIGGMMDDDLESSKEDIITVGLGVGAGGVIDELDHEMEEAMSSENENLVTIGLGSDC